MVPSSFMISQITPEGFSPARRETSTAASVWPARTRTTALAGTQREDVAGGWQCPAALLPASMATATVRARSWAEMPVETPSRASIETVKFVSCREEFCEDIRRQAKLIDPRAGHRQADQAAPVGGH